jgi:hypothetical protein
MTARFVIYAWLFGCFSVLGAGNAAAFKPIGPLNNMHGHRTALPNAYTVQIIKPRIAAAPIKIAAPRYQAVPRR